jgi:hypothetical protein
MVTYTHLEIITVAKIFNEFWKSATPLGEKIPLHSESTAV